MPDPRLWFPFGTGREDADTRLFCLPFAGGGASNFLAWRTRLADIGVIPVQYPGHETRLGETPLVDWQEMLSALADVFLPLLDRPYALFGYSMGARLAFALAAKLTGAGFPPERVIVAAHAPPDLPSRARHAVLLDDESFKQFLLRYGGIPAELVREPGFWHMALPVMRADFALAAQPFHAAPAPYPIVAYAGMDDADAGPQAMSGWGRFATAGFALREFAGGHFFLRTADVCAALDADLAAVRSADSSPFLPA